MNNHILKCRCKQISQYIPKRACIIVENKSFYSIKFFISQNIVLNVCCFLCFSLFLLKSSNLWTPRPSIWCAYACETDSGKIKCVCDCKCEHFLFSQTCAWPQGINKRLWGIQQITHCTYFTQICLPKYLPWAGKRAKSSTLMCRSVMSSQLC